MLRNLSRAHKELDIRIIRASRTLPVISRRHLSNTSEAATLRRVFDDTKYFIKFNATKNGKVASASPFSGFMSAPKAGLFLNEYLTSPQGLLQFSMDSLAIAQGIVGELVAPNQSDVVKLQFIKKIDQLSDVLCRVIDVAEFIRVVHPSGKWKAAAQQTHEMMFEFMNQLNTNIELYKNLVAILEDTELTRRLTDEELKVGDYLAKDFERSGIDLDDQTRENFVNITQEISLIGSEFNKGTSMLADYWCEVTAAEYDLMPKEIKHLINKYLLKSGRLDKLADYYIPLAGEIPYEILNVCENEELRKKIWILLHSSTTDQIHLLNGFLKYRAVLANMLGYKSFSAYQLEHKMAKSPENVMSFLGNLQSSLLQGGVMKELETLQKQKLQVVKNKEEDSNIFTSIKPWDRDYLLRGLDIQKQSLYDGPSASISEYLSIGTIVSGLSTLFTLIYGISLVPIPTEKGETWDQNHVRKLAVFDNNAQLTLGYLYLDFWSPTVLPSHFTIVCLRQLNDNENVKEMSKQAHIDSSGYQLPVISLVCNFSHNATYGSSFPTLLNLDEVDTIFHEMGHAMHSMIGRTKLHNLAGTRCLTDFVELPSVLMEFFSKDKRVIGKIAKHYSTDEPLPIEMYEKLDSQRSTLENCETYIQSKMAMLDQVLHSESMIPFVANGEEIDSTAIYHSLEEQLKVFADKWTTWHAKFPHLFSYGAVYYSYLLDRAIAEKVWLGLFKNDPWSRDAGEKYKESILKWGGTKDPWECLADALSNEELRNGDGRAMEIIGKKSEEPIQKTV